MIRTRFAPSPNGLLHMGHAYAAVVAHDLARARGGEFLLRIEDIDGTRSRAELVPEILADLEWLGLQWDGPVVFQSGRIARYAEAGQRLIDLGLLYPCTCTRREVAEAAVDRGPDGPIYPGTCRGRKAAPGDDVAWRLDMARAVDLAGPLNWIDELAGPQRCWPEQFGDVVLLRRRIEESELSDQRKVVSRRKLDSLLQFCESTTCRRVSLLTYLGEASQPCGNCDICLEPGETWDATVAAQKLLSVCWRTGQRFGIGHLIDVLRGETTEKVTRFAHEQLPVFGIGRDVDTQVWKWLGRQLVSLGYLIVDSEQFNTLAVSESARPLLKGEAKLAMRRPTIKTGRGNRRPRGSTEATVAAALTRADVAPDLWEALRDRRRDLAAAQNLPPYVIFHDATLLAIAQAKPARLEDFLHIPGIGERKMKRYGADFLEVLSAFR